MGDGEPGRGSSCGGKRVSQTGWAPWAPPSEPRPGLCGPPQYKQLPARDRTQCRAHPRLSASSPLLSPAGRSIRPQPLLCVPPPPCSPDISVPCISLTVLVDTSVFLNALRVHLLNLSGAGLNLEVLGPSAASTNLLGLGRRMWGISLHLSEPQCSICEMGLQRSQSPGQV